ncbi:MAG: DUF2993 domain-containing protein [Jaaginema sp. PMC 1079.18]|nr:DUF2993 domain-containing protein [Jaaginema sp. PMC 1080.18]MEC4853312.1 DUF2993 domain-containing protein [Jaaginema sp. PMC 1079.18]MEC4868545.1 DUF2993 domain-containing protein [Jaaginema sp. PMC 1078.18]
MIFGIDNFSEGAVSKVAEIALSSQIEDSDKLKVDVSTDPASLADGTLDAMVIHGEGLVLKKDLRIAEMKVSLGKISINPLKAITGNLELCEPTQGTAHIAIAEADLNQAFNSDYLEEQIEDTPVATDNQESTLDIDKMTCHLLQNGEIAIEAIAQISPSDATQSFEFISQPRIREDRRGIVLENIRYQNHSEVPPELTDTILNKATQLLDLSTFEMPGISLELESLQVTQGQLILDGIAYVTELPS